MNGQALGTDKFEVDWHPGARPDHAAWQGRVWTRQQLVEVCGLGTGAGLLGWNCRHTYYPFIEGISVRNHSDEWLEEMDRKEAQRVPFRGKEYNAYEATQKQRQMETAMRAQREKAQLLKQGDADPDEVIFARCKYQAQLDEYKEFCRKMNLPEQRERIYYDLHGRVAPSQSTYNMYKIIEENRKKVVIPDPKIDSFFLKPGAKHAKEFFDVGYTEQSGRRLRNDILAQYDEKKAVDKRVLTDGAERFSIFMELGTGQRRKTFRTVWQKDSVDARPRLITGHRE